MSYSLEPIMAKEYMLDHYDQYGLGIKSRQEMLALLNILQACGETLDSLHDVCFNGWHEFCDIIGRWDTDEEVYRSLLEFNQFFTESEFIDFILEQYNELKEDRDEDPAETIREWTVGIGDTVIERTEDGYVRRLWY